MANTASHWNTIYETKELSSVSWFQSVPELSLQLFSDCKLPHDASIIDIGGGHSFLVDNLIKAGYSNLSVLDVAEKALEKTKTRLGKDAEQVQWIVSDIVDFAPDTSYKSPYDFWHDRAVFHFLTSKADIQKYVQLTQKSIKKGGYLLIATFSEKGPLKCSGLTIQQYSQAELAAVFAPNFTAVHLQNYDHTTPSGGVQNFTVGLFHHI